MVSFAYISTYATLVVSAQQLFYYDSPSTTGGIFFLIATQIVAYGIAGKLTPYLVYPFNMIFPSTLFTIYLLKTFNTDVAETKWRTKLFFMVFSGIFVYGFLLQIDALHFQWYFYCVSHKE